MFGCWLDLPHEAIDLYQLKDFFSSNEEEDTSDGEWILGLPIKCFVQLNQIKSHFGIAQLEIYLGVTGAEMPCVRVQMLRKFLDLFAVRLI